MFGVLNTICCMPAWSSSKALYDPLDMALSGRWVGFVGSGIASYVAPRVALSSAKRASRYRNHFRPIHLSRAHAAAPSGAPLYVADRGCDERSDPHHSAARDRERGAGVCAEARRLDRGAFGAPAGSGELCSWGIGTAARRPHRSPTAVARAEPSGPKRTRKVDGFFASSAKRRTLTAGLPIFCGVKPSAELETASLRYASELGVNITRVSVRDQASRWGSCSTTGVLSYSWRLFSRRASC